MIKLIIYILITFFLDNLFNNLEITKNLLFPHLVLSSLIIIFIMLKDNKSILF